MATESTLRAAITFLNDLGVYDVVLPFILVFSVVFAILEKTKVFGMEVIDGKEYTRKNVNAMVAFVMALLVVGSAQIVQIITNVSANVVILLMASVLFLLLIGSFYKEEKGVFLTGGWKTLFMWIMFIGLIILFINAFGYFDDLANALSGSSSSETIGLIILVLVMIFFIWFVVRDPTNGGSSGSGSSGSHH